MVDRLDYGWRKSATFFLCGWSVPIGVKPRGRSKAKSTNQPHMSHIAKSKSPA